MRDDEDLARGARLFTSDRFNLATIPLNISPVLSDVVGDFPFFDMVEVIDLVAHELGVLGRYK